MKNIKTITDHKELYYNDSMSQSNDKPVKVHPRYDFFKSDLCVKLFTFFDNAVETVKPEKKEELLKAIERLYSIKSIQDYNDYTKTFAESSELIDATTYTPFSKGYQNHAEWRQSGENKLKGDLTEFFAYIYFNVNGGTEGIYRHELAPYDAHGIDMTAYNIHDTKVNIQVKYVHGEMFTGKDLLTFWKEAATSEGSAPAGSGISTILFTTANRVSGDLEFTNSQKKSFKVITRKHLKKRCNCPGFWNTYNHYLRALILSDDTE